MGFLYDTGTLFGRYLTKLVRNPTLLATNLGTPVLFLILFSQLLGKLSVFPGVGGSFLSYLTPGIVEMVAIMFGAQAGLSIFNDLNSGFLQKMLVTPVSRFAIILGRLLTDALMILLATVLVLVTALLMGATIATGLAGTLLLLATAAFFGLAWAGVYLALGMTVRSAENINAISSAVVFILLFVSSAMFPASILPGWAQTFSDWNPVSYVATALRALIQSGYDWNALAYAYVLTGALVLVAFAVVLVRFRKTVG